MKFARRNTIRISLFLGLLAWLVFFIASIPGGSAPVEQATAVSANGISAIYDNPINAPYKIITSVATTLSPSIKTIRSVSLLVLVGTATALFYALRHWHTKSAAGLATLAFTTNALVLSVGRLGTPLISVFGWFIFTALLLWQIHGRSNKLVPGIVLCGVAFLLYTPGAPWFFLVFLFFYWSKFKVAFVNVRKKGVVFGGLAALTVFTPLAIAFARKPELLTEWLLLPEAFTLDSVVRSLLEVPSAFLYKMPANPLLNVSTLPVFDLASGFLFLIGLNAYRKKSQLDRTRLMVAVSLVGVIIGAFGDVVTAVVLLLPFAFSMVAAGAEFMLDEWNAIFPKNPFARSFGVVALTTVVLFGSYYQLTRFLVVWPQAPETRDTYTESRIID